MQRKYYILFILAVLVYITNMQIDVMLVDAAQYAEMSWEMLTTGSYLKVYNLGANYLDKPPLLFWLNSISMALFGVSNFSYKLPSVLFVLLGVLSTYKLARLYYDSTTASMAAVMLATTQAAFLITNDVRTDTMLMGAVAFATWQTAAYFERGKWQHLLLMGVGIALAMLTKGPIGLIAPGASLFLYVVLKKKWASVFNWRIVFPIIVIAVMLLPMCIGLYEQHGTNGLRFYFWTQSFGRITGESEWNNNPDPIFLIHTTAWSFLPWTLFFFIGWLGTIYKWIRGGIKHADGGELISVSGFTLVLIMLMRSNYQLPHYIYVVYPLAAIIAARCFVQFTTWAKAKRIVTVLQLVMLFGLIAVSALLQYAMKGADMLSLLCLIVLYPGAIFLAIKYGEPNSLIERIGMRVYTFINRFVRINISAKQAAGYVLNKSGANLFWLSAAIIITFNFMMGAFYFPAMMKYQCGNDFGKYLQQHAKPEGKLYVMYGMPMDFAHVFYAQQMPDTTVWDKDVFAQVYGQHKNILTITTEGGLQQLQESGIPHRIVQQGLYFQVAKLNLKFLNPATRASVCEKQYLVETY